MVDRTARKEFSGRFAVSYKDGEVIYGYDDITHGLYKIFCHLGRVDMVLLDRDIHRGAPDKIMGISKSGNEVILIPSFLDSDWVFYDTKERKARYEILFRNKFFISDAITIGSFLFLIPGNIYTPILIFSFHEKRVVKSYENWYEKNQGGKNGSDGIWGASVYGRRVVFPVVFSKDLVCVDIESIDVVTLDIPDSILSVSIYKDRIWILPESGECIYLINLKGTILEKINLSQTIPGISASDFIRIVAVDKMIFLFPQYGKNICVYQYVEKKIVQIKSGIPLFWGRQNKADLTPYWAFAIENETMHMLPHDCRYKRIDIYTLDNEERMLSYGENVNFERYWKAIKGHQKRYIYENGEKDLEGFFQYIFCLSENDYVVNGKRFGSKIWKISGSE